MHRVAWDLRYPDPPTLNYGYYGTLLDYREYTLELARDPGKTPRTTLVGPMVLPGTYTATLTVDGQRYTQPSRSCRIRACDVPPAALAAQFQLQQRMVAGITATYQAVNLRRIRATMRSRRRAPAGRRPRMWTRSPIARAADRQFRRVRARAPRPRRAGSTISCRRHGADAEHHRGRRRTVQSGR